MKITRDGNLLKRVILSLNSYQTEVGEGSLKSIQIFEPLSRKS